jgi:UDP-N-acetylmuramoyl-tripeptide--D-alanyl-D-alanine ligase
MRDDQLWVSHHGVVIGSVPVDSGVHAANLGCAVASALAYGVDERTLGPRVATLSAPAHRAVGGRSDAGVWVIDDTFNANPVGAAAAVDALVRSTPSGRRAVVTPGMVELGPVQDEANTEFAGLVAGTGATLVVVGRTNRKALTDGAAARGGPVVHVPRREQARAWVRANLTAGDGVLWENDLPDQYP